MSIKQFDRVCQQFFKNFLTFLKFFAGFFVFASFTLNDKKAGHNLCLWRYYMIDSIEPLCKISSTSINAF